LGVDVNDPDSKGTLPVYWAGTLGHVETVKVLVEVAADTEALMTVDGMETKITALKLAVCQSKLDAIRVLAECGANVDDVMIRYKAALNDQVDVDGRELARLEQVCSS
jgi:hypothetical protein